MATQGISGPAVAIATVGGWLLLSGIRNYDPINGIRALLAGDLPTPRASDVTRAAEQNSTGTGYSESFSAAPGAYGSAIYTDARRYLGVSYSWGHANPLSGFDCSGLVNWVIGHDLNNWIPGIRPGSFTGASHGPDTTAWLSSSLCTNIPRAKATTGDLAVWTSHMGIVADSGAQNYLYAPTPGQVVKQGPVNGGGPIGELVTFRRYSPPQTGQPSGRTQ